MKEIEIGVRFFAHLRERVGRSCEKIKLRQGATVSELWDELISRYPALAGAGRFRVAVNQEYASDEQVLADSDEVAIIPPVSGGSGLYAVTERPIDLGAVTSAVADPRAGATVVFVGTTRNQSSGRTVEELEYEAYGDMAEARMRSLGEEIQKRWPVVKVAMVHRVGRVGVGEASVAIAVSGAHRAEAFDACRFGIDELKKSVPIWKKEHYRDGSRWVG